MRILIAFVTLAVLTSCGYGEHERVLRSLTGMEQVARSLGPGDDPLTGPRRVGEAEFQAIYRVGDRVHFQVGEAGPGVDPHGYVWSPGRAPVDDSGPSVASSFEHLQGPWYRWSDSY
ncbi:hypothetical protein HCN51_26795 [Nonomuraea sp. FMUSA5-5]|uniref:DUF4247 domain-containing protein n=1 Tax=Nonomuraea composti TaxID=2720023 RepID=A0ABX1B9N0_9ACTN|nr:hypothetical protein [Nonomuraea sp. FMUSA5-5]NJP93014.1 hypothetical protein [Nonomuraea sp. FMUSA5-5]